MRSSLAIVLLAAAALGFVGDGIGRSIYLPALSSYNMTEPYEDYDSTGTTPRIPVNDMEATLLANPGVFMKTDNTIETPGRPDYAHYRTVLPTYRAAMPTLRFMLTDRPDVYAKLGVNNVAGRYGYTAAQICAGTPSICDDWDGDLNGITGDGAGGFDGFNTDWVLRVPRAHWDAVVANRFDAHDFCTAPDPLADGQGILAEGSDANTILINSASISALTVDQWDDLTIDVENTAGAWESAIITSHTACTPGTCQFELDRSLPDGAPPIGRDVRLRAHNLYDMKTELCALLDLTSGPALYGYSLEGGNAFSLAGAMFDVCNADYRAWKIAIIMAAMVDSGFEPNEPVGVEIGTKPGVNEIYLGPTPVAATTTVCDTSWADSISSNTWFGPITPAIGGGSACIGSGPLFHSQYEMGDYKRCSNLFLRELDAAMALVYSDYKIGVIEAPNYRGTGEDGALLDQKTRSLTSFAGMFGSTVAIVDVP